jgi:hypothetical protein
VPASVSVPVSAAVSPSSGVATAGAQTPGPRPPATAQR